MNTLVLTEDQQKAFDRFSGFLADPKESAFIISGYAGTGKSTLVKYLLDNLKDLVKTIELLTNKELNLQVELTATTNKAAQTLSTISGMPVSTIHSFLGLSVTTDYRTGHSVLNRTDNSVTKTNVLLIVDEASFIDAPLLKCIRDGVTNSKILFLGDPAQLTPVKRNTTPVWEQGYPEAKLEKVIRQAEGNQILDLATEFRHTVHTRQFFSFSPNNKDVIHLPRDEFNAAILKEFDRPDWEYHHSKVLAWTNKCVVDYNHAIRGHLQGEPEIQEGDYAIVNQYIRNQKCKLSTDQLVEVTSKVEGTDFDTEGWWVTLDDRHQAFLPKDLATRKAEITAAKKDQDTNKLRHIDNWWIDLRAAYACTINKSQGSTFDRVFIDLDDLKKCHNGNQLARMMYVGVSRARYQVFLTGDLV